MSNSEIIKWLKMKAETTPMPGARKMYEAAAKRRDDLRRVRNTRRITFINSHNPPKMRGGYKKGENPSAR